ncbi:MAG: hypothetical protein ACOCP8_07990 [archaeon]
MFNKSEVSLNNTSLNTDRSSLQKPSSTIIQEEKNNHENNFNNISNILIKQNEVLLELFNNTEELKELYVGIKNDLETILTNNNNINNKFDDAFEDNLFNDDIFESFRQEHADFENFLEKQKKEIKKENINTPFLQ